jgi:uncharacterized membrane protein YidH (DUF202 family)
MITLIRLTPSGPIFLEVPIMSNLHCPHCNTRVLFEQRVSGFCPFCGKPFPADRGPEAITGGPSRPRGDEERPADTPRPDRSVPLAPPVSGRIDSLGWGTVRAGLALVVFGTMLASISLFLVILVAASTQGVRGGWGSGLELVPMMGGLASMTGVVLAVAGMCMGSAAPSPSGARGYGVAVCIGLGLFSVLGVINVGQWSVEQREAQRRLETERLEAMRWGRMTRDESLDSSRPTKQIQVVSYLALGVAIGVTICYLLFLSATARALGRHALARGVRIYLVVHICFSLVVLIMTWASPNTGFLGEREYILWGILGGGVALTPWYLLLVGMVRGAVTRRILQS